MKKVSFSVWLDFYVEDHVDNETIKNSTVAFPAATTTLAAHPLNTEGYTTLATLEESTITAIQVEDGDQEMQTIWEP